MCPEKSLGLIGDFVFTECVISRTLPKLIGTVGDLAEQHPKVSSALSGAILFASAGMYLHGESQKPEEERSSVANVILNSGRAIGHVASKEAAQGVWSDLVNGSEDPGSVFGQGH